MPVRNPRQGFRFSSSRSELSIIQLHVLKESQLRGLQYIDIALLHPRNIVKYHANAMKCLNSLEYKQIIRLKQLRL